jgi:hypothetical protein
VSIDSRQRDEKRLRDAAVRRTGVRGELETERRPQSMCLRRRKRVEQAEDRSQQPVQRGERQRCLGLDTLGPQDAHPVVGVRGEPIDERGLAGAGFTVDEQHPGAAGPRVPQHPGDPRLLGFASVHHAPTIRRGG